MDVNHLHLHVQDVARSRAFYEAHLGFRFHVLHGRITFLRNEDGFDLALAPAESVEPLPAWFHFGTRLASPDAVRTAFERMRAAGVRMREDGLLDERDIVSFRCYDPDGYAIEVYWE
jgi:catechol 2,3-dioxygenase-like lactoylglutathione lyase family enzyme